MPARLLVTKTCLVFLGISSALAEPGISFSFRLPGVGESSTQDLQFLLHLQTRISQGGKPIEQGQQTVDTRQRRAVTVLATGDRTVTKAKVHYEVAQQSVKNESQSGTAAQPVDGKAYVVERRGEELVVTTPAGTTPPDEELQFVRRSMDAVGRVNPLADCLDGKTLAVGESLDLPAEAARNLLGLDRQVRDEAEFRLVLLGEHELDGVRCAEFQTHLKANARAAGGFSMLITGKMWIDPATCRAVAAELQGPVAIFPDSTANPHGTSLQADGRLKVALRSRRVAVRQATRSAGAAATGKAEAR